MNGGWVIAELKNVGPAPSASTDFATRKYTSDATTYDMAHADIDPRVAAGLVPYATKAYVDGRDALLATRAYVDAGDATRLKVADKDVAGGVPGLGTAGRINRARINVASAQEFPQGLWTPTYASPVTVTGLTESTLFTHNVTDPGFDWRPMITGSLPAYSQTQGAAPVIRVRVGSDSGPIVAEGWGTADSYAYLGLDEFDRVTSGNLGGDQYWVERNRTGSGGNAACNGTKMTWVQSGAAAHGVIYQRGGTDAVTVDDYQEVVMSMASAPQWDGNTQIPGRNRIYGRQSTDCTYYTFFEINLQEVMLGYRNGGSETQLGSTINLSSHGGNATSSDVWTGRFGTASGKRYFQLLRGGTSLINYNDTSGAVTSMGADYRHWGMGMEAGWRSAFFLPFDQALPADVGRITINDTGPGVDNNSYAPVPILPVPADAHEPPEGATTTLSGAVTLYITLAASIPGGTVVASQNYHRNLSVLALPV